MYEKELAAIRAANRLRERKIWDKNLIDFASNDYLGLSTKPKLLREAIERVEKLGFHSPKASLLVNGYTEIHAKFEEALARINGFERGILLGSGFLANIALIESLVRANDVLFMDKDYHASGKLATRLLGERAVFFEHNDPNSLLEALEKHRPKGRIIIAIEGVYSMSGTIAKKEFAQIADFYDAILIVDEAHSSGTIGANLLGYFDHYDMVRTPNYIKLGTLSKAYASYGAYILASEDIVCFLENRAKSIIYTTALSLLDSSLGFSNFLYIQKNSQKLREKLEARQNIASLSLSLNLSSPILAYPIESGEQALNVSKKLRESGFLVGAIRKPTVEVPILRVILRCANKLSETAMLCEKIKEYSRLES
ncbi:MAG: aminotransferase class I/II-fold pyridoxal phosphate-dependent enzyme [Wolinella sp.]